MTKAAHEIEDSLAPVFTALGRLNYAFTNTESLFIHVIAGLLGADKEAATIVFLTLNTTRARLDLVERLAKRAGTPRELRDDILETTREFMRHSPIRNRFNHCIYAFDTESGRATSILMRIADRGDALRIGKNLAIDETTVRDIENASAQLIQVNAKIWKLVLKHKFPT